MSRFGPTLGGLRFRLWVSLAGLAFLAGAMAYRGLPTGPAMIELGIIGAGVFGGSALWSARKLMREDTR